ncbi:MAG: cytochrome c3 family protein [Terriglobales bacterium]
MKRFALFSALMIATTLATEAQVPTTNVIGIHDMGPGGQSPIKGGLTTCEYCHAPHSGLHLVQPLWSQKLSVVTNYTLYADPTMVNTVQEPPLGSASNLCLSCHDGTVAPGETTPYGTVKMSGSMNSQDVFGANLQGVHPFNFKLPLQSAPDLLPSLVSHGVTGNPAVKLISGNVQCTTCHEPHVQVIDPVAQDFLVMNNANSALCLACHVSAPNQTAETSGRNFRAMIGESASSRTSSSKFNPFTSWLRSAHGQVSYKVSKTANLGPYGNTRQNGCLSCHAPHKAPGAASLLTGPAQPVPNMDTTTQNCISCHNGGSNISPAIPNVFAEFAKIGHPFPTGHNQHSANESEVLNKNRHATCVDCHDPHASSQTASFALTSIRGSQYGAIGINASDGTSVVSPAANQFETCLRCHGTSAGKQILSIYGYLPTRIVTVGDPLNVILQFNATTKSSHPVMHDSNSPFPQPSLLKFMWNLDGRTQGRAINTHILCTDCHNSDDNREFGGSGPNGPHGSRFSHILERRYEFSQVVPGFPPAAGPGTTIRNLLPPVVDPAADGPYSLCAKCHNLSNIMSNASFSQHALHINAGFSCSVCHTAHGIGGSSASISGERLVNFDLGVVAENDSTKGPISYSRAAGTCTLKCHNVDHNANGTVTSPGKGKGAGKNTR